MTTEGTYPYVTGGVSTWAHILIEELMDIDFILLTIMMHPYVKLKFELPSNVVDIVEVPLWGTEDPLDFIKDLRLANIYEIKNTTRKEENLKKFVPILNTIVDSIYGVNEDFELLGDSLLAFHDYFNTYDYHETFISATVWDAYKDRLSQIHVNTERDVPTLFDFVEGLRFLYRFFISMLSNLPEAEIYHSTAAAFCGLPCILAKKKYGSKFILTEHGIYIREQYLYASREKIPLRTKEFLLGLITMVAKLNYYFADAIFPVCDYNQRWELQWGAPKNKILTIYNGIDIENFSAYPPSKQSARPTVVMVARIDPLKDIETFIRTCNLVAADIPTVHFRLYGPGPNAKYKERCVQLVIELKIENNFTFEGLTSNPATAYNQADVILLTSISEAFPFAVIEAMACEKVVISSDVGGTKEVLEGFGYIVKPKDYHAFAKYTIKVLSEPEMAKEMGMDARNHILNGFTIEDMTDQYRYQYIKYFQQFNRDQTAITNHAQTTPGDRHHGFGF